MSCFRRLERRPPSPRPRPVFFVILVRTGTRTFTFEKGKKNERGSEELWTILGAAGKREEDEQSSRNDRWRSRGCPPPAESRRDSLKETKDTRLRAGKSPSQFRPPNGFWPLLRYHVCSNNERKEERTQVPSETRYGFHPADRWIFSLPTLSPRDWAEKMTRVSSREWYRGRARTWLYRSESDFFYHFYRLLRDIYCQSKRLNERFRCNVETTTGAGILVLQVFQLAELIVFLCLFFFLIRRSVVETRVLRIKPALEKSFRFSYVNIKLLDFKTVLFNYFSFQLFEFIYDTKFDDFSTGRFDLLEANRHVFACSAVPVKLEYIKLDLVWSQFGTLL